MVRKILTAFYIATLVLCAGFVSSEEKETKPPKPRFERSELAIRDNKSGLIWLLNANIPERTLSWDGAQDYTEGLNRDKFAGYSDWRVPSLEELETLIAHVKLLGFDGSTPERTVAAGLRSMGIRNVQPDGYWSSTSYFFHSAEAWYVSMTNGAGDLGDKTLYFSIWPVRSVR